MSGIEEDTINLEGKGRTYTEGEGAIVYIVGVL